MIRDSIMKGLLNWMRLIVLGWAILLVVLDTGTLFHIAGWRDATLAVISFTFTSLKSKFFHDMINFVKQVIVNFKLSHLCFLHLIHLEAHTNRHIV